MSENQPLLVRLRRNHSGTQWGFRMQGGTDQESCLHVQKVNHRSIAERSGLRAGDRILRICNTPSDYLRHDQAKMEIIRSGNELDFVVLRNAVQVNGSDEEDAPSRVAEESTMFTGRGYANPNVQSRSFKILQESLNYSEAPQG